MHEPVDQIQFVVFEKLKRDSYNKLQEKHGIIC